MVIGGTTQSRATNDYTWTTSRFNRYTMRQYGFTITFCLILSACSTSTVYIVRHAEKKNSTDTSSLTPAGLQRAQALADALDGESISQILTTPYRRTQQTAQPLAQRLNVPITTYPAKPVDAVVEQLKTLKGRNVLVVGHSNTILDIARGLGARPTRQTIDDGDFDNLLEVTIRRRPFGKRVRLHEGTFGAPTAP